MSKLHAQFYADGLIQTDATIQQQELIAEQTYKLRVEAPQIASGVVPGHFVMIRLSGTDAPLIGRALAVYDVVRNDQGEPTWIDLVYIRKGTMTTALAASPLGTGVTLWGPLGNGFDNRPCDRLIMAAGGIGQTTMLLLGREALGSDSHGNPTRTSGWANHVELIYGARHASLLAGLDDFADAGFDLTLCTDDGSRGKQQRVPDALAERLEQIPDGESVRVATCGPEIMMEKVAEICSARSIDCQVSMETPMACGIGICFSCVAKVRQEGPEEWDYKRTCVEGPIFDADQIVW